ncbi:MAG: M56 family metallopeptidase [Lachnospiraceae bacterium]|nr:M56 family metallopeptidase [Lachnospiraceae bacterium]
MTAEALLKMLDFCATYLVVKAGRCIALSVFVTVLILLLRRTLLKKQIFGRGMLWCLLIPALFVGKLRFFYESPMGVRLFYWWHSASVGSPWLGRIYMLGVLVFGGFLLYRRWKLRRFVRKLEKREVAGSHIFVCDVSVSPFTTGLFRPRIVVPETMCENLTEEELQTVLFHERVHIRLGHLWLYLLWDIIRVILWPNLLLGYCTKYFRQDMEDICDRVTIQRSGQTAYEYGGLLLKSLRLLQETTPAALHNSVALAGETDYRNIKKRMERVVQFNPYKRFQAAGLCLAGILALSGTIWGIEQVSYPQYTRMEELMLYNDTAKALLINGMEEPGLARAITIESDRIYIDRQAMNAVLEKNHITSQAFFLGFGSYYKVPGIGGGGNAVYIDYCENTEDMEIPYIDSGETWENWLCQYLL